MLSRSCFLWRTIKRFGPQGAGVYWIRSACVTKGMNRAFSARIGFFAPHPGLSPWAGMNQAFGLIYLDSSDGEWFSKHENRDAVGGDVRLRSTGSAHASPVLNSSEITIWNSGRSFSESTSLPAKMDFRTSP